MQLLLPTAGKRISLLVQLVPGVLLSTQPSVGVSSPTGDSL